MIKQNTLISILIINYNNHKVLERSIKSCLKQSYKNIEILIFDDQSTDDSQKVLKKFIKNKKIKVFFNKNKKRNIASIDAANGYYFLFKKSKGEIICLLDSDDFYDNSKILLINDCFKLNKSIGFVQNLPKIKDNKNRNSKKKINNILSYWPYFAPESCISFRKSFFFKFLKKTKKYKNTYDNLWLGFRLGAYSYYVENNFFQLNKELTHYINFGQSLNYKKFNYNWWIRRYNSFMYTYKISKKKNILFNLDFFFTSLAVLILKLIN